jgi:hypothetical protein
VESKGIKKNAKNSSNASTGLPSSDTETPSSTGKSIKLVPIVARLKLGHEWPVSVASSSTRAQRSVVTHCPSSIDNSSSLHHHHHRTTSLYHLHYERCHGEEGKQQARQKELHCRLRVDGFGFWCLMKMTIFGFSTGPKVGSERGYFRSKRNPSRSSGFATSGQQHATKKCRR